MDFEHAFEKLIGHEGGYANDPNDPGKETKYGISKRSYPALDIKNITLDDARNIYKRDFWGPAGCDMAPNFLKFHLFDFAVNSGPKTAVRILQGVVGETQDGVFGSRTLAAVNNYTIAAVTLNLSLARLEYMTSLTNWAFHGKGWARRMCANMRMIVKDCL